MYDIRELEEAWLRYRKKRRRPFLIAAALFFAFIVLYVLEIKTGYLTRVFQRKGDTVVIVDTAIERNETFGTNKISLERSGRVSQIVEVRKDESTKPIAISKINKNDTMVLAPSSVDGSAKNIVIELKDTNDPQTLHDLEKRFKLSHDTDDSLFLAKSYYKRQQYEKAAYWAYQTNLINENIEEAWLVFVKSKYKLGRHAEAIKVLKAYIDKSGSIRAKVLLEKMQKHLF